MSKIHSNENRNTKMRIGRDIETNKSDINERVEAYKSDVNERIAARKAEAEEHIEDQKADLERHKADVQENIAEESTELAREWHALSSSATTRIGSVVLVLFLVRLFIRKRERSVRLATFYRAVGDALTLCGDNEIDKLPSLLPLLLPETIDDAQNIESPSNELTNLLKRDCSLVVGGNITTLSR